MRHQRVALKDEGFSLLEMMVVLAIIALTIVVAAPHLQKTPTHVRLESASRSVINALELTRAAAISRDTKLDLVFDLEHRSILSPVAKAILLPDDVSVKLNVALLSNVTSFRGDIYFFPDGSSTGGDISLTLGDLSKTVCVNWITGIVRTDDVCLRK